MPVPPVLSFPAPDGARFGAFADDYERGRMVWPTWVCDPVRPGVVVELGAGTGKLTRVLAARFDRVVAVEPDRGMLERLRLEVPAAAACHAAAESIPLPDSVADSVVSANAVHWFGDQAFRDIRRVLAPGGVVVTVLYAAGEPFPALPPDAEALIGRHRSAGGPSGRDLIALQTWRRRISAAGFRAEDVVSGQHVERFEASRLASYFMSRSDFAACPADGEAFRAALSQALGDDEYSIRFAVDVHMYRL